MLDDRQWRIVETFRDRVTEIIESRLGLSSAERDDRPDRRVLLTRWDLSSRFWLEFAVMPGLLQARVGLMTDDPLRSDDLRSMIEDSGYTLQEYVGLGLAAVGCDWPAPPVERYREQPDRYRLATPVDLKDVEQFAGEELVNRVVALAACYIKVFDGSAAM